MKIAVINGSMRHGSTWHCMDAITKELVKHGQAEVTEFFLPKEMPHFCCGCFSCFMNGEDTCPHAASVQPIAKAILESDIIILTSPVYGFDVSGQMKALIDHLCYLWMSHRPDPRMFNKIGLTITTAAGAGLGHTTRTMRKSLTFWGTKKVYSYKTPVSAMRWEDISQKKRTKALKNMAALAEQIAKSVQAPSRLPNPLFRSLFFKIMAGMQRKNDWNPTDRRHWEANGWLSGNRPF